MSPEHVAARRLCEELAELGIGASVIEDYGLAVISVWVNVLVWTNGRHYWWRTGRRGRNGPVIAWGHAGAAGTVARRVKLLYDRARAEDRFECLGSSDRSAR